jgi:spore germination protein YaaH
MNQYYVTFADAVSMNANRALAQQMGLKGVAYFKIDGDTDQAIWQTAR